MPTATVESGAHQGAARMPFLKSIEKFLKELLFKKKELDDKKAKDYEKQKREAEAAEKRREAEEKERELDAQMEYHERKSGDEKIASMQALRDAKKEEIKGKLDLFIQERGRVGSGYFFQSSEFNEFIRDGNNVNRLKELIDARPHAAYLIDELVTRGSELHGDAARLINISRDLLYEADKAGFRDVVNPLLLSIKGQVNYLIDDTIGEYARQHEIRQITPQVWLQWFDDTLRLKLPPERQETLVNHIRDLKENWRDAYHELIEEMFTESPERPIREGEDASWVNMDEPIFAEGTQPPKILVDKLEQIWAKVDQAEKAGAHLTTDQLGEVYRDVQKVESSALPPDLIPGTLTYNKAIVSSHRLVEERLKVLANKLNDRLKTERPAVKSGITDPQKFLEEMTLHPGHFGGLLRQNKEMMNLLVGHVPKERIPESVRFRNQVFLTMHSRILTDKHSSSGENFGLYERADLTTFLNILGSELARLIRPETGTSHGQAWVEWFTNLSSSIRLSRDIDFYASQPGVSIDDWARSFALFKNELSVQAMALPAVEQAYRALETTLRGIRDANGGYIPPGMVDYNAINGTSEWDNLSMHMLESKINAGVVPDILRDEVTGFHKVDESGRRIAIRKDKVLNLQELREHDPQKLEISMYMTLAKGFGLSSIRFLELFANSKVPGSKHPVQGMEGFHSTPYEGPARALNYTSTVLHKWKFGSYRYMQIMNMLIPDEKRRPMNEKLAWDAWRAYLEGPEVFAKKFGEEARRNLDKLNFSNMSSAFGSNYTWRQMDSTIGWSDKQRELMGGPMKIIFKKRFAEAKVKEYWVDNKYKAKFRKMMGEKKQPTSGAPFDRLWKERGLALYQGDIDREWKVLKKDKRINDQIKAYSEAFTARSWVETAMRSPLSVAHSIDLEVKDELTGQDKRVRLHNLLVQKVLGIPPEYTKYAALYEQGTAAAYASPTKEQLAYIKEVMSLEEDLAIVRERALAENRESEISDFDLIKDPERKKQAKTYWEFTQKALFGTTDYKQIYKDFGMQLSSNGEDYDIDWSQIGKIKETLHHIGKNKVNLDGLEIHAQLNHDLITKEWDAIQGTDATAFRQMDLLNLGARQWVRVAGDAAAHFHGGEKVGAYFTDALKPKPDVEDLAKALYEVRKAYEGDAIEPGWKVGALLAHATARLYGFDYRLDRLGSPAQLDIWKTRRDAAAWYGGARRKYYDALEHMDILPPTSDIEGYDVPEGVDIHHLREIDRASDKDVLVEIITLGILLAVAITLWRALTAKSEEEEGGGGGGGH